LVRRCHFAKTLIGNREINPHYTLCLGQHRLFAVHPSHFLMELRLPSHRLPWLPFPSRQHPVPISSHGRPPAPLAGGTVRGVPKLPRSLAPGPPVGKVPVPNFSISTRSICRRSRRPSSSVPIPSRSPSSMHPHHFLSSPYLPAHPASRHGSQDPCIRSSSSPLPANVLLLHHPLPLSSCTQTGVWFVPPLNDISTGSV
jgi:hypothetical protein